MQPDIGYMVMMISVRFTEVRKKFANGRGCGRVIQGRFGGQGRSAGRRRRAGYPAGPRRGPPAAPPAEAPARGRRPIFRPEQNPF